MATTADEIDTPRLTLRDRFAAWTEIMQTANPPAERPLDTIGKWLVITRAAVFPMTIWSGTIGALLAAETATVTRLVSVDYLGVVLAIVGLVIAHAANNMINDYFDTTGGVDTEGYVRALYAPHPILSGWVTKATLRNAILLLTGIDALIMLLAYWHGPLVIVFALAGLFLSVFYVAPPLNLKRHGLGEVDVFLTWGPLMIGGTYLVATSTIPLWVLVISVPYALLVTSVLFGKHIDKIVPDTALGHSDPAGDPGRAPRAPRRPGSDDRVLPAGATRRARRLGRTVGAAVGACDPEAHQRAEGLQPAEAHRAAAVVPGQGLAAVVRRLRVHPYAPGRRTADARTTDQRPRAGEAAAPLALVSWWARPACFEYVLQAVDLVHLFADLLEAKLRSQVQRGLVVR